MGYCSDKKLLVFGLQQIFSISVSHNVQGFRQREHRSFPSTGYSLILLFVVAYINWNIPHLDVLFIQEKEPRHDQI